MPLVNGHIYSTPDGKRFCAQLEKRQYAGLDQSWALLPTDEDEHETWRDRLGQMLFIERGRIIQLNLDLPHIIVDTGWTAADLRAEICDQPHNEAEDI